MSGTFEDLKAWQCAMDLALDIYKASSSFPKHEIYGLTNQLRRAAVSVASNIAEGKGHASDRSLFQFLNHARGSIYEVQTQLLLAERIGYLDKSEGQCLRAQASEVGRLINGFIKALEPRAHSQTLDPRAQSLEPRAPNP